MGTKGLTRREFLRGATLTGIVLVTAGFVPPPKPTEPVTLVGRALNLIRRMVTMPAQAAPIQQQVEDFNILLGRPTDGSITANVIPDQSGEISFEYGTTSGVYISETDAIPCTIDEPVEVVIDELASNTRYYYRLRFRAASGDLWTTGAEYSFHTQRAPGSTFTFTIIADSHLGAMGNSARYNQATLNVAADNPDFHLDLGDTFIMDSVSSQAAADARYLTQRSYFGNFSHSAPVFLAIGNHENEEGWNFDDTPTSQALMSVIARKRYYLNPITDGFYSGNDDLLPAIGGDQLREDYYAWEWGDALFVVLDPFHYTMANPYGAIAGESGDDPASGDQWNWTLGLQQFNWFKQILESSNAPLKFVFAHHVTGGQPNVSGMAGVPGYVRGGANAVPYFEWGGQNADGTWGFDGVPDAQRLGWGDDPIHQLMVDNGVSVFFHGHDHQYAHEVRDGIVYQSVPAPGMTGNGFNLYSESDPYTMEVLPNSGHLRVTVSPDEATVDYVRSDTAVGGINGEVTHSYTVEGEPTAVTLASFTATPKGGATSPVWKTTSAIGLLLLGVCTLIAARLAEYRRTQ
jgi:hypothetical protein